MSQLEQYDERIARIRDKMEVLKDRKFQITCGEWEFVWEPPMTEEAVSAFEEKKGIRLPEDYRRFLTTTASGGSQPFYGLQSPTGEENSENEPEKVFPHTVEEPVIFIYMTEEQFDDYPYDDEGGFLTLCTEGDGMDSVLVVNSDDPETYGTVWFFDFANDFGLAPMKDPETGRPFHFLDWLEYWVDRTAKLKSDEYFSFMDVVQMPEPPENPEILGRKMGWIQ